MTARTLLALAALALAVPAAADEPRAAAPAQASTPPAAASPPERARVRASHRVDVIAPGDRVETVIDRLRASRPPATGAVRGPAADRPVRGPEAMPPGDRPGSHGQPQGPQHGEHGMLGGPAPPGGRTGTPPDHHRR